MKKDEIKGNVAESEKENNEARLSVLVDIFDYSADSFGEFLEYALKQTLELTKSQFGYIYQYDEDRKEFIFSTWTEEKMKMYQNRNHETPYPLSQAGIWGEAVRLRKPILINDFGEDHPLKKGLPPGHFSIDNFLAVPVFEAEKIIGMIGLANKDGGYDEDDILLTTLLMEAVFNVTEVRRAEEQLREVSTRLELATRAAGVGVWDWELDKDYMLLDDQMMKLYDLNQEGGLIKNEIPKSVRHPDDWEETERKIQSAINGNDGYENEFRIIWRDGSIRHIRSLGTVIRDEYGEAFQLVGVNLDITKEAETMGKLIEINEKLHKEISERVRTEEALRASEEKFRAIVNTSPDGIIISSMEGITEFVTEKALSMWGYDCAEEVLGRNILDFVHESARQEVKQRIGELSKGNSIETAEFLMVRKDGSLFYSESKANIIHDKNKRPEGILLVERDVTQRRRMEDEVKELAVKDQLTGLFNRRKIDNVMNNVIKDKKKAVSVVIMDIDHFKMVNDMYGHLVGDQVLVEFGRILKEGIRKTDILGRWGGEEFIIVCPDTDLAGAIVLAEKLRKKIAATEFKGIAGKTASFGVAQLKSDETMDELISRCDQSLYRAKARGRNRVVTEQEIGV